jgi:nucleoside-diphosphate-sugar epimerase
VSESWIGVAAVAHLASIMTWDTDPSKVIPQVIALNINLMKAAANEPSVRRFVFTSSSHAAIERRPNVEYEVTENSWNESVVKAAWKHSPDDPKQGFYVYGASKAQGEQAVWKWFRENQPDFDLNVGRSFAFCSKSRPSLTCASHTKSHSWKTPERTRSSGHYGTSVHSMALGRKYPKILRAHSTT